MASEQVVITGCGVVASNAVGWKAFGDALAEGKSGIGELVGFDASDTGRERAAEAQGFDVAPFLRSPKNYLDRNSALAFAACEMAVRQSGLALPVAQPPSAVNSAQGGVCTQTPEGAPVPHYGLCVGSMAGNLESLAAFAAKVREKGARFAPPFLFPHTYFNTTAGLLSIEYGLTGPHGQFCAGGAAGLEAVTAAADCVAQGRAGMMVGGGAEAFSEWLFRACLARGWLSPTNSGAESCRPFAAERNGTILGEGAAFFVLQPEAAVVARGARILGRVLGWAGAASVREAMSEALDRAEVRADSIDAIFAAAGGYAQEDEEEAAAIRDAGFGPHPQVVALKGLIGETLGASGALNLAAALGRAVQIAECRTQNAERGGKPRGDGAEQTFLVNAGSPGAGRWVSAVVSTAAVR